MLKDYLTKRNEEFDEALPTFYGGKKGQWITSVKLTEKGLIKSAEVIKSFNQETVDGLLEEMEKIVEGKTKGVSHVVYLTNPPQYPKENSEQYVDGYNDALKSISSLLKEQRESLTK